MAIVLNDLYDYGLKIYQDSAKFKFSLDSLLLSEYVEVTKKDNLLLDLCTGNAPLPLILANKYPELKIIGVEIQPEIYNLAQKSIQYNHLEDHITLLNINAKDTNNYFPGNNFDIITCNPPFFKTVPSSLINSNASKAIARHELTITLADIFHLTKYLLKDNGKFYLVHRPERLEEIIKLANAVNLHLKKMEFVTSNSQDYAIMVLFKFVKNAQIGTKIHHCVLTNQITTYQNIFKRR